MSWIGTLKRNNNREVKKLILLLIILIAGIVKAESIQLSTSMLDSSCEFDSQFVKLDGLRTICPEAGLKYIISDKELEFSGTTITRNNLIIQAPAITFLKTTTVNGVSLILSSNGKIVLGGELNFGSTAFQANILELEPTAILRTSLFSKFEVKERFIQNGILSSAGDEIILANDLVIKGAISGLNSVVVKAKSMAIDGRDSNLGQILSPRGKINIFVDGQVIFNSGLILSKNIESTSTQFSCINSKTYAISRLLIRTFGTDR